MVENRDKLRHCIKKQTHHFVDKILYSQSYGSSSCHVQMWELVHKEDWALRNWHFWIVVWRRLLKVPWTARRSNQSILKEIRPEWIFIERIDTEAPILWPPDVENWFTGKDPILMQEKTEGKGRGSRGRDGYILSKLQGIAKDRWAWRAAGHGITELTRLSNWTTTTINICICHQMLFD